MASGSHCKFLKRLTYAATEVFSLLDNRPAQRQEWGNMRRKPCCAKALFPLIVIGLLLPMMISIALALAVLLAATGDDIGGRVLRYLALAGGVTWVVDLVSIILVQAIAALDRPDDEDG